MHPPKELLNLGARIAERQGLDPALVCAVIEQESGWDPNAIRFEPGFRERYVAPLGLSATEEISRSMSWGLMQVLGQVAREHGYKGNFLAGLCDPSTNLEIGCVVLARKLAAADGNVSAGLLLWNGGSNPSMRRPVRVKSVFSFPVRAFGFCF